MQKNKPTLAIYGIQDRLNSATPFYVHDHALTLMHQGKVIRHLSLERHTRKKHDNRLFDHLYELLKQEELLSPMDYDLVFVDNVVGRTFLSSCGRFRFEGPLANSLSPHPEKGRCWWLNHEKEAHVINHELAHIGANLPFCQSFKENSLLVHFDGGASLSNFSAWIYKNQTITPIEAHWDLKFLSSFFNANAIVFGIIGAKYKEQNSVPGKMMGLAAFGNYDPKIEAWLLENDYFANNWGDKKVFFQLAQEKFNWKSKHLNTNDPFLQDIVATLHQIFERDFLKKITQLQEKTGTEYLYYSGGSALNIVTNSTLVQKNLFKDIFIPPCPDDSGLSLGAAALLEYHKHGKISQHSPYLNNWGLQTDAFTYTHEDVKECALALLNNKVIAVCNGNAEMGPRALGNRSILALPNSKKLADKVSMVHKKREWYRPVAPVMLECNAKKVTGLNEMHHLSQLMLLDFAIKEEFKKELEGITHINGTARIQTIEEKIDNPWLFDLLSYLDQHHNIKALINTSFNIKGEPIVHTSQNALNSAKNMNLDGLVINGKFQSLKVNNA